MATFVSFINWTDQGVKNFRESGKRADAFAELVQSNGGSVKVIYWTLANTTLAIHEATDAETATAVLLQVGSLGNLPPPGHAVATAPEARVQPHRPRSCPPPAKRVWAIRCEGGCRRDRAARCRDPKGCPRPRRRNRSRSHRRPRRGDTRAFLAARRPVLREVEPHVAPCDEHKRRHVRLKAVLAGLAEPQALIPLDGPVHVGDPHDRGHAFLHGSTSPFDGLNPICANGSDVTNATAGISRRPSETVGGARCPLLMTHQDMADGGSGKPAIELDCVRGGDPEHRVQLVLFGGRGVRRRSSGGSWPRIDDLPSLLGTSSTSFGRCHLELRVAPTD